jgi:hypothetical protein
MRRIAFHRGAEFSWRRSYDGRGAVTEPHGYRFGYCRLCLPHSAIVVVVATALIALFWALR